MHGTYNPLIVSLSIAVAVFASFVALNLAGRLLVADRASRVWWLSAASLALGGGIWSMHFIGMLALVMPVPTGYAFDRTLISLILPIVVVAAGLQIASYFGATWRALFVAGTLIGLGVVSMHYVGMAAMRMPGVTITYDPKLVATSVAIAIAASLAAVWVAFRQPTAQERVVAAVLMGVAIAGMHYTGMAAATVTMTRQMAGMYHDAIPPATLAAVVSSATVGLLLLGLVSAFFDSKLATLTEREAEMLRSSDERHRLLIRNADGIIAVMDGGGILRYEGSSALAILGYTSEEMVGRPLESFLHPDETGRLGILLAALQWQPGAAEMADFRMRHRDGKWRNFSLAARNLIDDPVIGGIVLNLRDVTDNRALLRQLEDISETDLLTGIANRRGFIRLAELAIERARRSATPLTLVMLDLDYFKRINDTYGHAAGDLVLAKVADECRAAMRSTDILGRLGGEEFVMLMEAEARAAEVVVTRLREAIARSSVATIKGNIGVTASFGVAGVDPRAMELETALRIADDALYEAKRAGRNCVRIRA